MPFRPLLSPCWDQVHGGVQYYSTVKYSTVHYLVGARLIWNGWGRYRNSLADNRNSSLPQSCSTLQYITVRGAAQYTVQGVVQYSTGCSTVQYRMQYTSVHGIDYFWTGLGKSFQIWYPAWLTCVYWSIHCVVHTSPKLWGTKHTIYNIRGACEWFLSCVQS
jgi:hypothetical protein